MGWEGVQTRDPHKDPLTKEDGGSGCGQETVGERTNLILGSCAPFSLLFLLLPDPHVPLCPSPACRQVIVHLKLRYSCPPLELRHAWFISVLGCYVSARVTLGDRCRLCLRASWCLWSLIWKFKKGDKDLNFFRSSLRDIPAKPIEKMVLLFLWNNIKFTDQIANKKYSISNFRKWKKETNCGFW